MTVGCCLREEEDLVKAEYREEHFRKRGQKGQDPEASDRAQRTEGGPCETRLGLGEAAGGKVVRSRPELSCRPGQRPGPRAPRRMQEGCLETGQGRRQLG